MPDTKPSESPDFALPGGRYPIHNLAHAEHSLRKLDKSCPVKSASEQAKKKIYARWPELKPTPKKKKPSAVIRKDSHASSHA